MTEQEIIDTAILANSGDKFRDDWCHCEPEVNAAPYEYCAIFNGLKAAKELTELLNNAAGIFGEISAIYRSRPVAISDL